MDQLEGVTEDNRSEFDGDTSQWENHSLYALYKSGTFSDCKILCGEYSFDGHVCILASACSYFEKVFCGLFQEATDKTLDLAQDDRDVVRALIRFAYGCPYSQLFGSAQRFIPTEVRLYALADRLGYSALKKAAKEWLVPRVKTLEQDIDQFCSAIRALKEYNIPGDDTLQDLSDILVVSNIALLKSLSKEVFVELVVDMPDISFVMLSLCRTIDSSDDLIWRCKKCNDTFSSPTPKSDSRPVKNCPRCTSGKIQREGMSALFEENTHNT
ncbi:Hypothetical protein D9617_2g059100 [Elsinoe fawcettii]|nr:Hypothetical protein D9617_2g059100 [Elsinoe fawcettii]